MRYAVYRPRTRLIERTVLYAMLGVTGPDDVPVPWTRGYRRTATVFAHTVGEAAVLGAVLMGDVLVPATGSALLCMGDGEFSPLDRPKRASAL